MRSALLRSMADQRHLIPIPARTCTRDLVRGIRYHPDFKVHLNGTGDAVIRRALNARLIMSNQIPQIQEAEHFPYCIWHPEVASEETYRALARRYYQMKYQVGRACAVAGYTQLYFELGLLPDIAIAEEARDNGNEAIFDHIVAQHPRFAVMNDYTRSINDQNPLQAAGMNGDTAVRSTLEATWRLCDSSPMRSDTWFIRGRRMPYFDITEDWSVAETAGPRERPTPAHLLYTQLPYDLPAGNKDLVILSSAYYGDIDRYARLRRPELISNEVACILRGIYHHTMFAKWWSMQPNPTASNHSLLRYSSMAYRHIQRAVNARFIMNNDISRISPMTPAIELPYVIWYPDKPSVNVLERLFAIQPAVRHAIARTAIILENKDLWQKVNPVPDGIFFSQATKSHMKFFEEDFEQRARRGKGNPLDRLARLPDVGLERRRVLSNFTKFEETWSEETLEEVSSDSLGTEQQFSYIYDGAGVSINAIERFVCSHIPPPAITKALQDEALGIEVDVELGEGSDEKSWTVVENRDVAGECL